MVSLERFKKDFEEHWEARVNLARLLREKRIFGAFGEMTKDAEPADSNGFVEACQKQQQDAIQAAAIRAKKASRKLMRQGWDLAQINAIIEEQFERQSRSEPYSHC